MMKLKKLALATSIALSAMAAAGTAQAGALATSVLDITAFTISKGGAIVGAGDFVPGSLAVSNSADITTTLNGVNSVASDNGSGEDIDLPEVSQGTVLPPYTSNSFAVYSNPPVSTFSLADQLQTGSPISGLTDPNTGLPIPTPGTASHAAYVALEDAGDGSSAANNGLNTAFTFALGEGGALTFDFNARAYLEAFTDLADPVPTTASASYGLIFTIEDLSGGQGGGVIVNWEPDNSEILGAASNIGIASETDPFDLNDAISRNAPSNGVTFRGASEGIEFAGSWSATTIALLANNDYQLTIRSNSAADGLRVEAVPEPATLALMGLGILGLGLSRRRRA